MRVSVRAEVILGVEIEGQPLFFELLVFSQSLHSLFLNVNSGDLDLPKDFRVNNHLIFDSITDLLALHGLSDLRLLVHHKARLIPTWLAVLIFTHLNTKYI